KWDNIYTRRFCRLHSNSDIFLSLLSFVFNIFMFCYIGEQLTEQVLIFQLLIAEKIGHPSYKIEWYHLREKIALDLTLMISMSHHPIKITAGKLINLSFSSFGNVSTIYCNVEDGKVRSKIITTYLL
ncbi:uncharacterized protein, partial [Linepithema humile]|uniref:uncharacterized protein n=1 Tax=Linepithema humile TaxID=83485 RepID=UPI00351F46D9